MRKFIICLTVLFTVLPTVVFCASVPVALSNWKIPQVRMDGTISLYNGFNQSQPHKGVYDIRSWYFKEAQVHVLWSQKDPGMRLVLYKLDGSSSLSYWSMGNDEVFGSAIANVATDKKGQMIGTFSVLSSLNDTINEVVKSNRSVLLSSSNDREGTITSERKTFISTEDLRIDSQTVVYYRDNVIVSRAGCNIETELKTGVESAPRWVGRHIYSGYSSEFPGVPLRCSFINWGPPDYTNAVLSTDWEFKKVVAIPAGLTAKQVISEVTPGLILNRWPAKAQVKVVDEKAPFNRKYLVLFSLLGIGCIIAIYKLWHRRRKQI